MSQNGLQMKYFVLRPKGNNPFARASRAAMRTYASAIREDNRQLSDELHAWADAETCHSAEEPTE